MLKLSFGSINIFNFFLPTVPPSTPKNDAKNDADVSERRYQKRRYVGRGFERFRYEGRGTKVVGMNIAGTRHVASKN